MATARGKANRPYRTGGIFKDPGSGRYLARVSLPNGTRPKKWFDTEGKANQWINNELDKARNGLFFAPGSANVTVAAWAQEWLCEKETKGHARGKATPPRWGTLDGYRRQLNWFLKAYGDRKLQEITPEKVEALYDWLRIGTVPPNRFRVKVGTKLSASGGPLKVQGIVHLHHVLRPMFKRARRKHLILEDPMEDVDAPGIPRNEKFVGVALDVMTWQREIELATRKPNGAAVVVMATLGSRRGEIIGLTWADVALDEDIPWVRIRRTMQRVKGEGLRAEDPKSVASERLIAIPRVLADALRAHRTSGKSGPKFVFTRPRDLDQEMAPEYLTNWVWKPIRVELGLAMRPHDNRWTLKSIFTARTKLKEEIVKSWFGWAEGGIASHYTQLRLEETKPVADEIDRLYSGSIK